MSKNSSKTSLFFFAGEPSGDLHGESLMQALNYKCLMHGVGGPKMRALGLKGPLKMEDFALMGIWPVIKAFPRLRKQFYQVAGAILEQNPDILVLIDYPGFNLRLMRRLRRKGYSGKIVQYIAPSVWAHGQGRKKLLEKHADLLCTIYPFESELFKDSLAKYIGNPLVDALPPKKAERENILALFPGSRKSEIHHNLPILLRVAERLKKEHPELQIEVSNYKKNNEALMEKARLALAVSGTVTLELALRETPAVVCYKVPALMYAAARWALRIRLEHFCIVNILMKKTLFPEFFQVRIDEEAMFQSAKKLFEDPSNCYKGLEELKKMMGEKGAANRASEEILALLRC